MSRQHTARINQPHNKERRKKDAHDRSNPAMRFTAFDYSELHDLVFEDGYPGYKPEVQESPDGDGVWDTEKRYAHIAPKYLTDPGVSDAILGHYYDRAFVEACRTYESFGFPEEFKPDYAQCCMRVLDYPPGAESAEHTDFDFMTLQLFRDTSEGFVRTDVREGDDDRSHGIHFGEIAELAGFRKAIPHKVIPLTRSQKSIVFFVLPSLTTKLGKGTVGEWLTERYARSRKVIES